MFLANRRRQVFHLTASFQSAVIYSRRQDTQQFRRSNTAKITDCPDGVKCVTQTTHRKIIHERRHDQVIAGDQGKIVQQVGRWGSVEEDPVVLFSRWIQHIGQHKFPLTHIHQVRDQLLARFAVGHNPEVRAGLDTYVIDAPMLEQNVTQGITTLLVVAQGDVSLGVEVNDKDTISTLGKVIRQVDYGCGLAYFAFLVSNSNNPAARSIDSLGYLSLIFVI